MLPGQQQHSSGVREAVPACRWSRCSSAGQLGAPAAANGGAAVPLFVVLGAPGSQSPVFRRCRAPEPHSACPRRAATSFSLPCTAGTPSVLQTTTTCCPSAGPSQRSGRGTSGAAWARCCRCGWRPSGAARDSLSGFACRHLAPQMLASVCNRTRGLTKLQGNQLMAN